MNCRHPVQIDVHEGARGKQGYLRAKGDRHTVRGLISPHCKGEGLLSRIASDSDLGTIRFRPMLLTAATLVIGSSLILFDSIFQSLAVCLMAAEVTSTLHSRTAVPILHLHP